MAVATRGGGRERARGALVWVFYVLGSPIITAGAFKYIASSGIEDNGITSSAIAKGDSTRAGLLLLPLLLLLPSCAALAAGVRWTVRHKHTTHVAYCTALLLPTGVGGLLVAGSFFAAMGLPFGAFCLLR